MVLVGLVLSIDSSLTIFDANLFHFKLVRVGQTNRVSI